MGSRVKNPVDKARLLPYTIFCVAVRPARYSGCGTVWLVYLVWDQGVAGSNPVTPIDGHHLSHAGVVQW